MRTDPSPASALSPARGVNLVGFSDAEYVGGDATLEDSLASLAKLGANWVAIVFWWFQDHARADHIRPLPERYTIADDTIAAAIGAAQRHGLRVLLRPLLDVADGTSRTSIRPSRGWYDAYRAYVLRYAALAHNCNCDALSIGAELTGAEPQAPFWRDLATAARGHFRGPLVYSANHDAAARVTWWDAVDIVGVDAYYPVAQRAGEDAGAMAANWSAQLARLQSALSASAGERPIWLTELGVMAARGAPRAPWAFARPWPRGVDLDVTDLAEQRNYYAGALQALREHPRITGVFWWSWYPTPGIPAARASDFSPQGKPAAEVLALHWARDAAETT